MEQWTSQFMSSVKVMVLYVNFTKLQVDPGDPWVSDNHLNFMRCFCWYIGYVIISFATEQLNNEAGSARLVMIKDD